MLRLPHHNIDVDSEQQGMTVSCRTVGFAAFYSVPLQNTLAVMSDSWSKIYPIASGGGVIVRSYPTRVDQLSSI